MLQLMPADCNNASAAMRKDLRSGRWKIFENDFVFPWLKSSLGVASHGASLPDHQVKARGYTGIGGASSADKVSIGVCGTMLGGELSWLRVPLR